MGVKWVKWVVGESVLPKCLTLSRVPRVVEISEIKRIQVFTVFLPFES